MYEHPYLSRQITLFEQEQIERAAERRRFLIEHPGQIVARPEGTVRRMLRRVFPGRTGRTVGSRTVPARAASGCEQTAVAAR